MATFLTHHGSNDCLAEYDSDNMVECASCGTAYDLDEQDDEVESVGDGYYCTNLPLHGRSCASVAKEAAYRKDVAEALTTTLKNAIEEIASYDRIYKDASPDCHDHPESMLLDVISRLAQFGAGQDSGWRSGLMLGHGEAFDLRSRLENDVAHLWFNFRWDAGMLEHRLLFPQPAHQAFENARLLAHAGRTLLAIKEQYERTEKGAAA